MMTSTLITSALLLFNTMILPSASLTLVSDLRTPSFLIDMDMLHKANPQTKNPSLHLPKHDIKILPFSLNPNEKDPLVEESSNESQSYDISKYQGQSALGYLHASVIRAREDVTSNDDPTFLAELDLTPALSSQKATLVMGINNHHVGSYYWARAAGMGASMEAPGISFGSSCGKKGILRWDGDGPLDCNSNDGKRSEWVNFVRVRDNVQMLPDCMEDAIMAFVESFEADEDGGCRIYGFSSQGRPMGSEPVVVCKWKSKI